MIVKIILYQIIIIITFGFYTQKFLKRKVLGDNVKMCTQCTVVALVRIKSVCVCVNCEELYNHVVS